MSIILFLIKSAHCFRKGSGDRFPNSNIGAWFWCHRSICWGGSESCQQTWGIVQGRTFTSTDFSLILLCSSLFFTTEEFQMFTRVEFILGRKIITLSIFGLSDEHNETTAVGFSNGLCSWSYFIHWVQFHHCSSSMTWGLGWAQWNNDGFSADGDHSRWGKHLFKQELVILHSLKFIFWFSRWGVLA